MELQEEEVTDKPGSSSSSSSPSLSTLETSYPKLSYSFRALSSLVCLTNELTTSIHYYRRQFITGTFTNGLR